MSLNPNEATNGNQNVAIPEENLETPSQIERFFDAVFGATKGAVTVTRWDRETRKSRAPKEMDEFIANGPKGPVEISMQTVDANGKPWEQPAIAILERDLWCRYEDPGKTKGRMALRPVRPLEVCPLPAPSMKLRHMYGSYGDAHLVWLLKAPVDLQQRREVHKRFIEAAPVPGHNDWIIEELHSDRVYSIEELEAALPHEFQHTAEEPEAPQPTAEEPTPTVTAKDVLNAVFGDTEGNIAFAVGADGEVKWGDPSDIPIDQTELVTVSPSTKADDGSRDQRAVVTQIERTHTPPLKPSFRMKDAAEKNPGLDVGVWLADSNIAGVDLKDVAEALGGNPESLPDEDLPVLGTGGWTLAEEADLERIYTVEGLQGVLTSKDDMVPLFGATELDKAFMAREIEIAVSHAGVKTPPGNWRNKKMTVGNLFGILTKHKVGKKEGNSFLQGHAIDGKRTSNAMRQLDILGIDLDTGQQIDAMRAKIEELGYFAIIYTTHSHLKPVTPINRDMLVNYFDNETNLTVEHACAYLRNEKRYQPDILEGAEILDPAKHTGDGMMVIVKHKPMPKFRVVLVLEKPFVFGARGGLLQDGIKEWKERYRGASQMLGAFYDRACVDPARLFFSPRHAEGAEWYRAVIVGKALNIEDCPRVTAEDVRKAGLDPFARDAEETLGKGKGKEYKTAYLKKFFAKYAKAFDIETFLMDKDPDGDRGPRSSGVGRTHRCPNDDAHSSNPGDPEDKGFFCVNATESETGSAVAHCSHDTCAPLDRMDFVDMICERVGITDAEDLRKWVAETDEDDEDEAEESTEADTDDDTSKTARRFRNFEAAKVAAEAIVERAKGGNTEGIHREVERLGEGLGLTRDVTDGDALEIRDMLCSDGKKQHVVGSSRKMFMEAFKRGKDELGKRQREKAASEKDSNPINAAAQEKLEELLKTHAYVTVGADFRILREATVPHGRPSLIKLGTFIEENVSSFFLQETKKGIREVPVTQEWRKHDDKRRYLGGVQFEPPPKAADPGAYNLFSGFSIVAKPGGSWNLFKEHIANNICQGNEDYCNIVHTWVADIRRFPGRKMGCCLVLVGKKGAGKGEFANHLINLFGKYAFELVQRRHLTGNFNQHQRARLLMVCDETTWPGRQEENSILKNKITSESMLQEGKGLEVVEMSDYARILMTANPGWIVPAGLDDERRFFALGLGDGALRNFAFFEAMRKEMAGGGYERMAYDLERWEPPFDEGWNILRRPPATPWLKEQAEKTLSLVQRFLHEVGLRGAHTFADAETNVHTLVLGPVEVFARGDMLMDHFLGWLQQNGVHDRTRHMDRREMKAMVVELWGATHVEDRWGSAYRLPPLDAVQARLAKFLG